MTSRSQVSHLQLCCNGQCMGAPYGCLRVDAIKGWPGRCCSQGPALIVQPSTMLLLVKCDASHRCLSALPTAHLWCPASSWRAEAGEHLV